MASSLVRAIGAAWVLALGAGGCSQAIPEYSLYVQAFDAQSEQGEGVLNVVAQAERIVVRRRLDRQANAFDPDNAAYYLDDIDPPITAAIRASLRSLKAYNDALGGLASGEAAEVLSGRIAALTTNLAAGVTATSVAIGGPAAAVGAETLVGGVAQSLKVALPIFRQVTAAAGREAFRRQLVEAHPAMRELIVSLRNGTPAMYEVMKRSAIERGSLESATGRSPEAEKALLKNRQLLAAWVVLLDKTLLALGAAVEAARTGGTGIGRAGLVEASIELRVLAEQMRSLRLNP